jgi:hypothetical protein
MGKRGQRFLEVGTYLMRQCGSVREIQDLRLGPTNHRLSVECLNNMAPEQLAVLWDYKG